MLRSIANFFVANLGYLFFWILFASLLVACVTGRPQSSHPRKPGLNESDGEAWVARPLGPRTPPVAAMRARLIAFAGSALLRAGAC
jgi:hypothetical protein